MCSIVHVMFITSRPSTFVSLKANQLEESLLQVADGELHKDRHDSCSTVGQHDYTDSINSQAAVLIVDGFPSRSKNDTENERVEEVGVVGDSAERDPEFHRQEFIDYATISVVTDEDEKSQTDTPHSP